MRHSVKLFGCALWGALALSAASSHLAIAQTPLKTYSDAFEVKFDRSQPVVQYTIHVDPSTDSLGYTVEIRIRMPKPNDTLRLASPIWAPGAYRVANFYQYTTQLHASAIQSGPHASETPLPIVREDSSTWRMVVPGNATAIVRYHVGYPTTAAAAGLGNYSFYRPDGALLSGAMTYLYIVGQQLAPAHVTFDLPPHWKLATGLVPTGDPYTFFAPSYDILIDCPVLLGADLHIWPFSVDGVPHRIAYYATKNWTPFDSTRWVDIHKRIVETARDIMGSLPYREYTFIYEDGFGGGLEHLNSATMASPSAMLAHNIFATASLTAHEYFHAWNIKRARPVELGPFAYNHPVRTLNLWWAEGVTDFFADEILRRSGIRDEAAATRSLTYAVQAYLNNPGRDKVSPERSSWTTWDANTVNGGYNISYYTTGGVIGELLELYIRHMTNNAKGVEDIERYLFDHYAGQTGYTNKDLLNAASTVCGCDLQPFFTAYVSGATPFDMSNYLQYAGWKLAITPQTTDSLGHLILDLRGGITYFNGAGSLGGYIGSPARFSLSIPDGSFGAAGLVDGDIITTVNDAPITDDSTFKAAFAHAQVGSQYRVSYIRNGVRATTTVTIKPYTRVQVQIQDLPTVTPQQRAVREAWLHGS